MADSISWKKEQLNKMLMDCMTDCLIKLELSRIQKHEFGYTIKPMTGSLLTVKFAYRKIRGPKKDIV